MKVLKLFAILLAVVLLVAACATEYENSPTTADNGTSLADVLENPTAFTSPDQELTLTGHAANITSRFFHIQDDNGAELMVDFRGSQAFPQEGDVISITGQLVQDCCNPDRFMLLSFAYEITN